MHILAAPAIAITLIFNTSIQDDQAHPIQGPAMPQSLHASPNPVIPLQSNLGDHQAANIGLQQSFGPMVPFCDPAQNNCTGQWAVLSGSFGSGVGSGLHLEVTGGEGGNFGYFLVSNSTQAGVPLSQGTLCLGPIAIARYNVAGTPMNSIGVFDAAGFFQNLVGTSTTGSGFDVPTQVPNLGAMIMPGQTWHFQLWYRHCSPPHSNLSTGLSVTF